ncbi:MAG: hypothetical protein ACFCVD_12710 [Nodosilinea sp.]
MLIISDHALPIALDPIENQTVKELTEIWAGRYRPQPRLYGWDSVIQNSFIFDTLAQAASPEGRRETVAKLHRSLIKLNCEFADAQTRELHERAASPTDLGEAKRIVQCAVEIYSTLLEFYADSPTFSPLELKGSEDGEAFVLAGLGASDVIFLAKTLEPLLLEYQERHQLSEDWAKVGFLTTHLNFTNVALLKNLTTVEKFFIEPYFKFLEEQVALPWQRVCAAASTHQYSSPAFRLVKRMLPEAEDIAHRVYTDLVQQFPQTVMRRGRLDHPGVKHSCLRDLNMFQAYLWLCVLKGTVDPVEDELVRLCTMVMPRVGVPWEMTVRWCELLMAEVTDRVLLSHQALLEPYMKRFMQAFQHSEDRLTAES